jgi:triphosphoribosyl-dephospho-CoA synthase
MPICAGAGYLGAVELMDPTSLRSATELVMKNTSTEDAINTYNAIMNSQVNGLGKLKESKYPDLTSQDSTDTLATNRLTLYDVMEASANRDNISREWITSMEITFQTGYTTFQSTYEEFKNVNLSTVHTFLTILSQFPDTFIARRVGLKKSKFVEDAVHIGMNTAREVSERATQVLNLGGLSTVEGKNAVIKFDEELKQTGTDMNPGTTADLTASSLLTVLLCGLRP